MGVVGVVAQKPCGLFVVKNTHRNLLLLVLRSRKRIKMCFPSHCIFYDAGPISGSMLPPTTPKEGLIATFTDKVFFVSQRWDEMRKRWEKIMWKITTEWCHIWGRCILGG